MKTDSRKDRHLERQAAGKTGIWKDRQLEKTDRWIDTNSYSDMRFSAGYQQ